MSESAEVPVSVKNTEVSQEPPSVVAEINAQKPSKLKDLLGILSRQKTKQEVSRPQETADANRSTELNPEMEKERISEVGSAEPQIQKTTGEQTPAEEPAETQEITRAKKLVVEITREVKDWDSIDSENVDQGEISPQQVQVGLMTLNQMRDEVRRRLFVNASSKVIGAEYRARNLTRFLDQALENAQEELDEKRNIRRDFRQIQTLDGKIEEVALEAAEVSDKAQLAEFGEKSGYEIFSDIDPQQRNLVWDVVKPYFERTGKMDYYTKESLMDGGGLDNVWWSGGDTLSDINKFEILGEVLRLAEENGDAALAERMRVKIANWGVGITENIGKDRKEFYPEIVGSFSDRSREELLRHGINLAEIVDSDQAGAGAREQMAAELGVDASELSFLTGSHEEFLEKLIMGEISPQLDAQPEYLKKFLARELQDFMDLKTLANTFPIEKISTSEFFRILSERLSQDPVISEVAQQKIKAFTILGRSPELSAHLRENIAYAWLLQRIAKSDDWQRLGDRFASIARKGDELGLAWEYFRMASGERGFMGGKLDDYEISSHVPGIPENLQWGNLSKEQRRRFMRSWIANEDTLSAESVKVSDLNDVGKALITKTVLTEVIRRSGDLAEKGKADERNRKAAAKGKATLAAGDLMHGTDIANLRAILHGGDRAGEFLGSDQKGDVTPLGADFSEVLETEVSGEFKYSEKAEFLPAEEQRRIFAQNPFRAIYLGSIAIQYGAREEGMHTSQDAVSNPETGITLIFSRQRDDAFLKGTEYHGHMREHHVLVFVGLPVTEISGIIVNGGASETINKVKTEVASNGFYTPIYDLNGDLIFTSDEYDQMRE